MFNSQEEYNTLFAYYISNIYLILKLFTLNFTNKNYFLGFIILILAFYILKIVLFVSAKEEMKVWVFFVCFLIINDLIYYLDVEKCSI